MTIQPTHQVTPLLAAMQANNNKLPHNSLPTDVMGTVQSNAHSVPEVTLYNSLGVVVRRSNQLIGLA